MPLSQKRLGPLFQCWPDKKQRGAILKMKKHILCFGDSNTHGYCADPADCADGSIRFNEEERWTRQLQERLGGKYLVIEEGLSNRTTVFSDPFLEGLAAIDTIVPCMKSHEMIDLLIIMLGTNDTKEYFSASAPCIALGMSRLVKKAMATDCWSDRPNILVITPPPIREGILKKEIVQTMGTGCVEKSRQLAKEYQAVCEPLGVHFLDAGALDCEFNKIDCMHLTKRGHTALAAALGLLVPELVS